MKYSVFNKSFGDYSVYESRSAYAYRPIRTTSMGAAPQDVTPVLPADAVLTKRSQTPEGTIVESSSTGKDFLYHMLITALAIFILQKVSK